MSVTPRAEALRSFYYLIQFVSCPSSLALCISHPVSKETYTSVKRDLCYCRSPAVPFARALA
jgi:hypothetical protein